MDSVYIHQKCSVKVDSIVKKNNIMQLNSKIQFIYKPTNYMHANRNQLEREVNLCNQVER